MPKKKEPPKYIKTYSKESLPKEEFYEGYNALIKVLVDYYKNEWPGNKN